MIGGKILRIANEYEIKVFKEEYCKNDEARISIGRKFEVEVESFEELLPGKNVGSYATGNRDIENAFIMFRVSDTNKDVQYFPVFSETVGRKMLKAWGMPVPKKRSIFVEENNGVGVGNGGIRNRNDADNSKLRSLILFTRSLMILHIDSPQPMNGMLKELYEKLELHPDWKVRSYEIKGVNTALGNFLQKAINVQNENFQNLQDYIEYLQINAGERRLRNSNFDTLRNIMNSKYQTEQVYF